MDQRTMIGSSVALDRPIHRASRVPGCWCGSPPTAGASAAGAARMSGTSTRTIRSLARASADLTDIALRCVGLPVV